MISFVPNRKRSNIISVHDIYLERSRKKKREGAKKVRTDLRRLSPAGDAAIASAGVRLLAGTLLFLLFFYVQYGNFRK